MNKLKVPCLVIKLLYLYCEQRFNPIQTNLFCIHLIHRGYDPLDMEIVNTENKVTNILTYKQHT
jgi:hypothetical protein